MRGQFQVIVRSGEVHLERAPAHYFMTVSAVPTTEIRTGQSPGSTNNEVNIGSLEGLAVACAVGAVSLTAAYLNSRQDKQPKNNS